MLNTSKMSRIRYHRKLAAAAAAAAKMSFPNHLLGRFSGQKPLHDPDLSAQRLCVSFSEPASLRTAVKHSTASRRKWRLRTGKQPKPGVWGNCPWLTLWGTQGTSVTQRQSAEHRLKRPSSPFILCHEHNI